MQRKSPTVAVLLSFLLPGLGQLYAGQDLLGAAFAGADLLVWALAVSLGAWPAATTFHLALMFNSMTMADEACRKGQVGA